MLQLKVEFICSTMTSTGMELLMHYWKRVLHSLRSCCGPREVLFLGLKGYIPELQSDGFLWIFFFCCWIFERSWLIKIWKKLVKCGTESQCSMHKTVRQHALHHILGLQHIQNILIYMVLKTAGITKKVFSCHEICSL